jgi:hypothetical protein
MRFMAFRGTSIWRTAAAHPTHAIATATSINHRGLEIPHHLKTPIASLKKKEKKGRTS